MIINTANTDIFIHIDLYIYLLHVRQLFDSPKSHQRPLQVSAALHSKQGCSQGHVREDQKRGQWSAGKTAKEATDCYVLAEEQWMNQGGTWLV